MQICYHSLRKSTNDNIVCGYVYVCAHIEAKKCTTVWTVYPFSGSFIFFSRLEMPLKVTVPLFVCVLLGTVCCSSLNDTNNNATFLEYLSDPYVRKYFNASPPTLKNARVSDYLNGSLRDLFEDRFGWSERDLLDGWFKSIKENDTSDLKSLVDSILKDPFRVIDCDKISESGMLTSMERMEPRRAKIRDSFLRAGMASEEEVDVDLLQILHDELEEMEDQFKLYADCLVQQEQNSVCSIHVLVTAKLLRVKNRLTVFRGLFFVEALKEMVFSYDDMIATTKERRDREGRDMERQMRMFVEIREMEKKSDKLEKKIKKWHKKKYL